MKCDEFIEEYKKASNKPTFLKKHVVRHYLPYELKISEAKKIVKRTCYEQINGKEYFRQNSPAFFMLFMLRILADYTDIEWEENEGLKVFNDLSEASLLESIILAIPAKEYDTFNTVLQMVKDDEMENYRSIAGFFETKVDTLGIVLNALTEAIEKKEVKTE